MVFIHNISKLETTSVPLHGRVDKQIVAFLIMEYYRGNIYFTAQTTDKCSTWLSVKNIMLRKSSLTQKGHILHDSVYMRVRMKQS